ncbi:zinc metalloproteinase nas-12-like isoform X2 [Ptychodera flava]|uniref:zinc metalloproteinase nas-12-like isoform X2 n=1 Tax=Ptychodera flava TaxID=63121 RepID=UPI00396A6108
MSNIDVQEIKDHPIIFTGEGSAPQPGNNGSRERRGAMKVILAANEKVLREHSNLLREGDIYETRRETRNARHSTELRWENAVVPYVIDNNFTPPMKDIIHEAFNHFRARTCVRFVERTNEEDYLIFVPLGGCWSFIGRRGGPQKLSLAGDCDTLGTVIHEIMHALGFQHEQSRADRDDFVTILWKNIAAEDIHNFGKYEIDTLGAPYDFKSVMHYEATAFSINDEPTVVPKIAGVSLIDRNYFSKWDLFKINTLYDCSMTGLEEKLLPGDGECYEDEKTARDYRGTVSTTRKGMTCQNWFSQSPHRHPFSYESNGDLKLAKWGLGDHNDCRNPDNDPRGVWCYTTDPRVKYDHCDIGTPEKNCAVTRSETPPATNSHMECYRKADGKDYRGTVSVTEDGEPCIKWADVEWMLSENFGGSYHNHCRNPNRDRKPWCFTASWFGYCDVGKPSKKCSKRRSIKSKRRSAKRKRRSRKVKRRSQKVRSGV